jgi:hypothetical protein
MTDTDIEKVKIDILRDALKDVIDTVRALDRKIIFLVSYNAIFIGIILKIFLEYKSLKDILQTNTIYFYSIIGIICLFWVYYFILIMIGISPKINPTEVFKTDEDKNFSNNNFFVYTGAKLNILDLDLMIKKYNHINSYQTIEKLLYKEIGKISYIRDIKVNIINKSVNASWILTSLFIIVTTFFLLNYLLSIEVN